MGQLLFKYPLLLGLPVHGEASQGSQADAYRTTDLGLTLGTNKLWSKVCGFEYLFESAACSSES